MSNDTKHNWVELSYVPVEVHHVGDQLIVSASEMAVELSQEDDSVMTMCLNCKQPLSGQSFFPPCPVGSPQHPDNIASV